MPTNFGIHFGKWPQQFVWIDLVDEMSRSEKIASDNINQLCEELGAGSDKHKRQAISWLYYAQTTNIAPECIAHIRKELTADRFSLTNIGTSEEKLQEIIRNYHKRQAIRMLETARTYRHDIFQKSRIGNIRKALQTANLTPNEIGTCEDELAALSQQCLIAA